MAKEITREEAWALLTEYNKEPFHLKHGETVEGVMRWYAEKLGYGDEVDFWGIVGLLHDLDFEQFPEQHCIKSQEIMRERGLSERLIPRNGEPRLFADGGHCARARDGKGAVRRGRA